MSKQVILGGKGAGAFLSQFDTETRIKLQMLIHTFQASQERMVHEIYTQTVALKAIQEITGENFYQFVRETLNVQERTVRRYLHINTVLEAHFSVNGRIDPTEVKSFTQRALMLLHEDTKEEVIIELRDIAGKGEKIDEGTVRELLDKHADSKAEIEALKAKVKTAQEQNQQELVQLQLQASQLTVQHSQDQELLLKMEKHNQDLENELATANNKTTEVQYEKVKVDVVPEGYTTVEAAIAAKEKELQKIYSEVNTQQEKFRMLSEQVKDLDTGAGEFFKMKEEIEGFLLKFPKSLVGAAGNTDPAIKNSLKAMADSLLMCANHIHSAIA